MGGSVLSSVYWPDDNRRTGSGKNNIYFNRVAAGYCDFYFNEIRKKDVGTGCREKTVKVCKDK